MAAGRKKTVKSQGKVRKPATRSKKQSKPKRIPRVKRYSLRVSHRHTLLISKRRFKLSKKNRSDKSKQFVVPAFFSKSKEIAFKLVSEPKRKQKIVTVSFRPTVVFINLLLVLVTIGFGYLALTSTDEIELKPASIALPAPEKKQTQPPESANTLPKSEPIQLSIPSISLNSQVKLVGRLADGTMETPGVLEHIAGWYKHSPTPGELGPSVIVGHVDSYQGISVFWRLRELQPSQIVEITRSDGKVAKFEVTQLKQFDQANFPTTEVYGDIDYAGLRLITCGGTFDSNSGHYTQNTVVFARLVKS